LGHIGFFLTETSSLRSFNDFALSMSSIEHFGGIKKARLALQEMGRVLRPGGYAIITTEISLNGFATDQVFLVKHIKDILRDSKLSLVSDFSYATSEDSLKYLCDMLKDDLNSLPHVNLKSFSSIFTSGILVLRKEGSFIPNDKSETSRSKQLVWNIVAKSLNERSEEVSVKKNPMWPKIRNRLLYFYWSVFERII